MNDALHALMHAAGLQDLAGWARVLVYGLAALVCGYLGSSQRLAQRTQRQVQQLWLWLCALYLLAASSALVQGDGLWVRWVRTFAREQQAYGGRRLLQGAALLALVLLIAAGWKRHRQTAPSLSLRTLVLAGACGTLVLHALRYVSFHYTDLALNSLWLNHSLAHWLEGTSLGLVAAGSTLEWLRSYGHV